MDRYVYKRNGIVSLEITPYIYGLFIFDEGAKTIQQGTNSLFYCLFWYNWIVTSQGVKVDPYLTQYT